MQVDDLSQYTDEELEMMEGVVRAVDDFEKEDRRQQQIRLMRNNKRRKGRSLGGAKVKR